MPFSRKDIFVTAGWGTMLATIPLQTLYARTLQLLIKGTREPPFGFYLRPTDLLLMFLASVLVGAVLREPEKIVIDYVGAIVLSALIMFVGLSLPAMLGTIKLVGAADLLYSNSIVMVFNSITLGPIMICLVGGLLGGVVGEKLS